MVINHNRPVIQAYSHIRHVDVIPGNNGQFFYSASEIIGKVSQRPTGKRESGQVYLAFPQLPFDKGKRVFVRVFNVFPVGYTGFIAMGYQGLVRPGAHDVIPATVNQRITAVQEYAPGLCGDIVEQQRRIPGIIQFNQPH